jgi:hypothetical protein
MRTFLSATLTYGSAFVISRQHLALEAVALRQQLAVYKRKLPHPKLRRSDRLFWLSFAGSGTTGPKLSFWSSQTR